MMQLEGSEKALQFFVVFFFFLLAFLDLLLLFTAAKKPRPAAFFSKGDLLSLLSSFFTAMI